MSSRPNSASLTGHPEQTPQYSHPERRLHRAAVAEGPIENLKRLFDEPSRMYLEVLLERALNPYADYLYVYIVASKGKTLYIGVTNQLIHRIYQHKTKINKGFTENYHCTKLVYFEIHYSPSEAIAREKQLKGWSRMKKMRLIENLNPPWVDLSAFLPEWENEDEVSNGSLGSPPGADRSG